MHFSLCTIQGPYVLVNLCLVSPNKKPWVFNPGSLSFYGSCYFYIAGFRNKDLDTSGYQSLNNIPRGMIPWALGCCSQRDFTSVSIVIIPLLYDVLFSPARSYLIDMNLFFGILVRRARFELTTRPLSDVEHISDLHQRAVGSTVELPAHNFFLAQASRMVGTLGFDPSQEHPSGAKGLIRPSRVPTPAPKLLHSIKPFVWMSLPNKSTIFALCQYA